MEKLLVIVGPTATGKTDLALQLAKKFNGELISVDSRQVYRGLNIGTGKMPSRDVVVKKGKGFWEMDGVKVWMYDVVDTCKQYTVYDYVEDASRVIGEIRERGKVPIIVGGTGLYLKALLEGLPNLAIPVDQGVRRELLKLSKEELQQKLQNLSFKRWQEMNDSDRVNPRRLVRAIEIVMLSLRSQGSNKHTHGRNWIPAYAGMTRLYTQDYDILKIGLIAPREVLYQRVDERVIKRMEQGMVEEAKNLHKNGLSFKRMKQLGLEYGVLADYLDKKIKSRKELIRIMQFKIHGFVRRQLTWFKKEKDINWFNITDKNYHEKIETFVNKWYYSN